MKIGILGNMNNMYFSLARYLCDAGYDCELLIFDYEPVHFHPNADSYRKVPDITVRHLSWGNPAGFLKSKAKVKADLEAYDFLIGNGTAPAFVHSIGRVLNLFMPYGDDLYALPFPRIVHPIRQIPYLALANSQQQGILNCPYLFFDRTNAAFERVFDRLQYKGKRIVSPVPLFYHKEYESVADGKEGDHPYQPLLDQLRAENDLLVIQHVRQFWKFSIDKWHLKGNNYLIRGFAQFLRAHPGIRSRLLLFEYGRDVRHSKALVTSLGLDDAVVWFPKMSRKHLIAIIKASDLVVGELHHSWNTYCVVIEALAMGKPLMHKRCDKEIVADYPELYPMLHAHSAESVKKGLEEFINNRAQMEQKGQDGKEWYFRYCVERAVREVITLIELQKGVNA